MPSLLVMQWLIVGFFVLIHFLLGMIRGTAKSAWFLLAYVVTAILTFVLISNFTLTWFFTTQESMAGLIATANGWSGGFLTDYMDYLTDPAITPVIFMILDLVIKIILYSILFPIIRFLLTLIIFRPIWKHVFFKKMLAAQNEKLEEKHESSGSGKKFRRKKKLKINFLSRLSGGFIGAVRGVLVAFVFLLPILVFGSFIGQIDVAALTGGVSQTGTTQLAAGDPGDPFGLAGYATYLEQIHEMNEQGFAQITNMITVEGASFDRYVFDSMFTPIINDPTIENASVNFIKELENVVDVATIIVNNGYMERDWSDLSTITDDDIENAQTIIQTIGQSELLSYLLSSGLDKAPDLIPELVTDGKLANIDWESESLQATLDYLVDTNWHDEFNRIAAIVGALNDFMSPSEIIDLMDDPGALANLDTEQITALADVIRAVGDLHLLAGLNLGIEYAITLPDVQGNIAWSENPETYLKDKLGFILDNPEFFIGEDGQLDKIADLITLILTDDTTDLEAILNSEGDLAVIIESQSETLVNAIFQELADFDLIIEAIPLGVDFALYSAGGEGIAGDLAGDIETVLADVDWSAEIINVGDIYSELLSLSLETVLVDNPEYMVYIDQLLQNPDNMTSIRAIVSHIFEDSDLVGSALDLAAPYMIDNMIDDEQLKEIIQAVVLDANDDFDFNIGAEINNVLTVAEEISLFTSFADISNIGEMTLDEQLALVADFGAMSSTNYSNFRTALTSLQIFSKIDGTVAADLVAYLDLTDTVYIPTEMLFSDDIGAIIDLTRDVAHYFYTKSVSYTSYEDIDVTDLLETLKTDLLDSDERSDLLFFNLVYQAQKMAQEGSLSEFLVIPDTLPTDNPESLAWDAEMNALLGAIFDIAASIGAVDGVTLSAKDIQAYVASARDLPLEIITQYSDPVIANAAFGGLDSSQILRASIPALIDSQGEGLSESLFGHELATPSHLVDEDGLLDNGVFTDLINGIAILLDDMNQTLGFDKIGDLSGQEVATFLTAFNETDDASIQAFVGSDLIHGIVSDMITDTAFQQGLADTMNDAQDMFSLSADIFAVDPILLDASYTTDDVLLPDEVANILLMLKAVRLENFEFTDIGVELFTDMFDRNVDGTTGDDDFDRFLSSGYIYSVIDNLLRMDEISTMVSDQLGPSLGDGIDLSDLDFTIPNEMLGQQADADLDLIDAIEVDRIPKAEFRRVFHAIDLIELDELGISTFTSLVSPIADPDDFTIFMQSDFIYFILATLFDNDGFGDFIGDQLGSSFGDSLTLDVGVPTDAKGTQAEADSDAIGDLEVGRIKRSELRSLMISFSLIDIEDDISVGSLLHLFNTSYYVQESSDPSEDRDNDFYQFVDSKFLQAMVSQILLSDAIIDTIAGTDTANPIFDSAEFSMPSPGLLGTQPDGYDRLTKDEIYYIFNGLNALGIANFDEVDLGLDTIQTLDDELLLKANYLYEVLDLAIAGQDTLTIPLDAYESSGVYQTMIKKVEVNKLFDAINVLPEGVNITELQIGDISQADILAVIDVESLIINQMASDQVANALASIITIDNTILPEAYEITPGVNRLLASELSALVSALTPLRVDDLGETPDVSLLTIGTLIELHSLGLGTTPPNDYDSLLVQYLISDSIGDYVDIPTGAIYETTGTAILITKEEVTALISALLTIADDDDPLTDETEVLLSSVGNINAADLTRTKIGSLLDVESLMIDRIIANGIFEAPLTLAVHNAYAEPGDDNYDENAPDADIKREEMRAIVAIMDEDVLDINSMSDPINTDNVKIEQLQEIHYLGFGVDPDEDEFDSYIIHHLISQSISDGLSGTFDIPTTAVDDDGSGDYYLLPAEIQYLIDAINEVNDNDPNAEITSLGGNINDDLTPAKLENMLDYNSRIVDRMVGFGIITASSSGTVFAIEDAYRVASDEYYDGPELDLKQDEMYALVVAMGDEVLDLTSLGNLGNFDGATIGELQSLHDLGLGEGLVGLENLDYDSTILHNLISKSVKDVLTFDIPTAAVTQADPYYMDKDEVQSLIDAMVLITGGTTGDLTSIGTAITGGNLTRGNLETILDYDMRLTDRMVANGFITANIDVPEAYLQFGDTNYDAPSLDLDRDEMYAMLDAMVILTIEDLTNPSQFDPNDLTSSDIIALNELGLSVATPVDTYQSYMVHKVLSDGVGGLLNASEEAYLTVVEAPLSPAETYVKPAEIDHVTATMDILHMSSVTDLGGIVLADLSGLTAGEIETITEAIAGGPNTIVYYFVDEIIDPDENLPLLTDADYVMDGPIRVRLTRIALANALAAL